MLTPEQILRIRSIIETHHNAFMVDTFGASVVPERVLEELKALGLLEEGADPIKEAYLYGMSLAASAQPGMETMSPSEFETHLRKNPIALGPIELQAIEASRHKAAQYCKGLGNRIDMATGEIAIEVDAKLRAQLKGVIRTKTTQAVARRQSAKELKSAIGHATSDWARDLDRIAVTELQAAHLRGAADHYGKEYGGDVLVFRRALAGACKHCLRLHVGPDGNPRIYPLSVLEENGSNVGRKANEWLPVVGPVHPNCFIAGTMVSTDHGERPIESLRPGDRVLTRVGFAPISHVWASKYSGDIVVLETELGTIRCTPNHPFWVGDQWVEAAVLQVGQDLLGLNQEICSFCTFPIVDIPPQGGQDGRFAFILSLLTGGGVPITAIYLNGHFYVWEGHVDYTICDEVPRGRSYTQIQEGLVGRAFVGTAEFTSLTPQNSLDELPGFWFSPDCGMESSQVGASFFFRKKSHADFLTLASIPGEEASFPNPQVDSIATYAQAFGNSLDRLQLVEVQVDDQGRIQFGCFGAIRHGPVVTRPLRIVNVSYQERTAPVFNLTVSGVHEYVVDGVLVHNCQCPMERVPAGFGFDDEGRLVPGGKGGVRYQDVESMEKSAVAEEALQKAFTIRSRINFQGLPIVIENPVGSVRKWKDGTGAVGETKMLHAYGYIDGAKGSDNEELDVYIGTDPQASIAYIVHQQRPVEGLYDEEKVMLGFRSEEEALAAYRRHYNRDDFDLWVSPIEVKQLARLIRFTHEEAQGAEAPQLVIPRDKPYRDPNRMQIHVMPLEKGTTVCPVEVDRAAHQSPSYGTSANFFFPPPSRAEPTHTGESPTRDLIEQDGVERPSPATVARNRGDVEFQVEGRPDRIVHPLAPVGLEVEDKDEAKVKRKRAKKNRKKKEKAVSDRRSK